MNPLRAAVMTGTLRMGGVRSCRRMGDSSTWVGVYQTIRHQSTTALKKERVVILGSGWAGYALARTLSPKRNSRIIISPRSHFVFTPLLASTSVGTLEFRAAIEPVRRLGLTEFHQAWASSIDFKRKTIRVEEARKTGDIYSSTGSTLSPAAGRGFEVPYDKLIISVGCTSQTFGVEGVKEHACFLRDIGDARVIRSKVLRAFEKAALPTTSDAHRDKLLHFAIVGGGPTGIEFAAELHDLIHEDLSKVYPTLLRHVKITVYDIASKVLPMFDKKLAEYATKLFARQGIKVKTEHHLQGIRREDDHLLLEIKEEKDEVAASLVVWSTGLTQNPLVKTLMNQNIEGVGKLARDDRTGGFLVDDHMQVQVKTENGDTEKLPDVFAIGDCAVVQGDKKYPATAQVASQQAVYLGRQINKKLDTNSSSSGAPFKFRNLGTMAYLGSWRAIHQSSADELKGWPAWVLWRTAYLTKSMSIKNKILIPVYWLSTWIFGRDISRF